MSNTLPFIRWTLARECRLREDSDVDEPEATERQLRALRAWRDGVAEDHVIDGICVAARRKDAHLLGFVVDEVLQAYGGEELIAAQCRDCPANVLRQDARAFAAGCFGHLFQHEWPDDPAWDTSAFLTTEPRWYGLWVQSPLNQAQLRALQLLPVSAAAPRNRQEFAAAVELALAHGLALHVRSYPAGSANRQQWTLHPHCPRCKGTMLPKERRCRTCGLATHPEPQRSRKPRGNRPYVPLARILGAERAAAFVAAIGERQTVDEA